MMPEPLDHPAAWRGKELFDRRDWSYQLTSQDLEELNEAVRASIKHRRRVDNINPSNFLLPRFSQKIAEFQQALEHGSGAMMIRGFPMGKYDKEDAARIFWGICAYLGTPVSQSADGDRLFHVRDEGYANHDNRARGPNSRKKLSFHTDRCDVIAFMCLRQAVRGGENYLISSMTLYNEILRRRPDLLEALLKPYYYKRHNVDAGNDLPFCQQPVFSFCDGHFAGSLLRVLIERAYQMPEIPPMTEQQREALDFLEEVAEDPELHVSFRQEPGDMLLVNNWVTMHRRSGFEDVSDSDRRRHLLRVWLSVPNSRPLDPIFAANYGNTSAGAVRGGMHPKDNGD